MLLFFKGLKIAFGGHRGCNTCLTNLEVAVLRRATAKTKIVMWQV